MMRKENEVEFGLKKSEELFKKKFKSYSSLRKIHLNFTKPETLADELKKIIFATEICTLKWVLKKGGSLNALNKKEWKK